MPPTARQPQDRRPAKKTAPKKARSTTVEVVNVDPDDKYAATTWTSPEGEMTDLTVPSGQLCLARRPGVQGLMKAGILHDLDSLSGIVDKQHIKRVEGKPDQVDVASIMNDPRQLEAVMHTVDRVVCYVVVKPQILMTPNDPTSRVPGRVYADMVDLMDKMFILNFAVGGVRGLEPFREQFEEAMGGLGSQSSDAAEAQ